MGIWQFKNNRPKWLKCLDILLKILKFSFSMQSFKIKHSQNIDRPMQNYKWKHRKNAHFIAFITTITSKTGRTNINHLHHFNQNTFLIPPLLVGFFLRSFPVLVLQPLIAYMPQLTSIFGKLVGFLLNKLIDTGRCYRLLKRSWSDLFLGILIPRNFYICLTRR